MEPIIDKEPTLLRILKRTTNQKMSEEEFCESNENHVDDNEQRNANKPKTIKKLIFEISSEMMTLSLIWCLVQALQM
jgi:hypothetical protein